MMAEYFCENTKNQYVNFMVGELYLNKAFF